MTPAAEAEDHATTQAARWLVALEDEPDDRELRARFDAWLKASPANAAAWANTSDVYAMMAKTTPVHADRWAEPSADRDGVVALGRRRAVHRPFAVAVALALVVCLAFFYAPGIVLRLQADYVSAVAELRSLDLEDGSIVRLGPDSAVDVAYTAGERRVRLLKGEAFFDVTPDPARPFTVTARTLETTVLGTSFNVRLGNDDAEVAVRSGQVRVDYPAGPPVAERLQSGNWVHVAWNGRVERGSVPADEVAPWLHGQMIARDRPMAGVVDELRRYYGGAIVFAGSDLGRRRVTGVYNLSDPVAALRAIVASHGGSALQVSPWLLVVYGN